jgi:hypothetical protein
LFSFLFVIAIAATAPAYEKPTIPERASDHRILFLLNTELAIFLLQKIIFLKALIKCYINEQV